MKEIKLDQKQAQRFTDALDNPPEPIEKLREAFMDYYETSGGILGCLPGETPASIVLLQQEERHRATLAARDAEIERLKALVDDLEQDRFRLEWLIQDPSGYIAVDGNPVFTKVDLDSAIDEATQETSDPR